VSGFILQLGVREHAVLARTEQFGRDEVDLPAPEKLGQLLLDRVEMQETRDVIGLELHEDVDVAFGPEVVPQHRSEE